jgi:pilus assembly protein Flp/PilA
VQSFKKVIKVARGLKSNGGVTAVEYGLILGLIALAIVAAVNLAAGNLTATFNTIATFFGNQTH